MSAERAALVAIEAIARSALYAETRAPLERDRRGAVPTHPPTASVGSEIAGDGLPSKSVTAAAARAAAAFGELAEAVERAISEATR